MPNPWTARSASAPAAETILFQDQKAIVTRALIRCGSASYPIASIGSVGVVEPDRSKPIGAAFVAALVTIILFSGDTAPVVRLIAVVVTIGLLVRAIVMPQALVLRTGSGDQQVLTSRNRSYLETVKAAIERAIIERG